MYELKQADFDIVVVDDGSKAAFAELFHRAAAYAALLTQEENMGKGRALKTGLAYIRDHYDGDYTVVTLDADGQHTVSDAVRLCCAAEDEPDALILGSRRLKSGVPLRSRFGNSVTRAVFRLSTKTLVHDTQTGLRAFGSRLLPKLYEIDGERYEYEMNVLLSCAFSHIPIREIEIETIYLDGNAASHFDPLKDSCRVYKEIARFSASSFIGFITDFALYSLLLTLTGSFGQVLSLRISNIVARIVSAGVNYTLNRKLVFKSRENVVKSTVRYFALAGIIMIGNTYLLGFLVEQLGVNRYAAKIVTELTFFAMSWMVQRFVIFPKKEAAGEQINQACK